MADEQLSLDRGVIDDDTVDVVVHAKDGTVLDVIPAHMGDRLADGEPRRSDGRWSLHAATLWAHIMAKEYEEPQRRGR